MNGPVRFKKLSNEIDNYFQNDNIGQELSNIDSDKTQRRFKESRVSKKELIEDLDADTSENIGTEPKERPSKLTNA